MKSNKRNQVILLFLFVIGIAVSVFKLFTIKEDLVLNVQALSKENLMEVGQVVNPLLAVVGITLLMGLISILPLYFKRDEKGKLEFGETDMTESDETSEEEEKEEELKSDYSGILTTIQSNSKKAKDGQLKDQAFLNGVCSAVEAGQGVLYRKEEQEGKRFMTFSAGYAFSIAESETLKFEYGEGLVGQVAKEGSLLTIEDIPQNYVKIVSGLGQASPEFLLVVPIKEGDNVSGIMEIATFKQLKKGQIEMIQKAVEEVFKVKMKAAPKTKSIPKTKKEE